ncbi:early growth response protein 1 [Cryptococcus neoformans AD1-83a]|nr:early growth response protein 1 [Cryptococcus neoformans var. grubii AD1-83a]
MLSDQGKLQPFKCAVCSRRFTRMENLKRHSKLHDDTSERPTFPCGRCTATFSRADLRRRHLASKHGEDKSTSRSPRELPFVSSGVNGSHERRESVSVTNLSPIITAQPIPETSPRPLSSALEAALTFDFGVNEFSSNSTWNSRQEVDNSPSRHTSQSQTSASSIPNYHAHPSIGSISMTSVDLHARLSQSPLSAIPPSVEEVIQNPAFIFASLESFFSHAAHIFPFIHRATFDARSCHPSLLFGMMCIGLHMTREGSGDVDQQRAIYCYKAGLRALDGVTEISQEKSTDTLTIIHAHLLLEMYAIMALCGSHTMQGLRLHSQCVELSRKAGLMESYPTQPSVTQDLDSLWRQFVRAESHKRALYSLYGFDSAWYHFLSRPRCLSHLEIKHELPCGDDLWNAFTPTEWAHRSLIASSTCSLGGSSSTRMRFLDMVRAAFVNQVEDPLPLPLDSTGASLMTHFVLASVREMTGWTTMTGRSCFERFEALLASMVRLEPLVTVQDAKLETPASAAAEATWRMSMIELLLWSQSHTGGLVEDSIDAALAAITTLGANNPIELTAQIIQSVEQHITWFLLYLQRTSSPISPSLQSESPLLTFYLFKATIIAWQIVKSGGSSPLEVVGVKDEEGLLSWMKKMFRMREKWGVGHSAMRCLGDLHAQNVL